MKIRLAVPVEAEECWNIRNQAIRYQAEHEITLGTKLINPAIATLD